MINNGKLPYNGFSDVQWENFHKNGEIPKCDSSIYPLIKKCLEKDFNKRYSSFNELNKDLIKILDKKYNQRIKKPELEDIGNIKNVAYGHLADAILFIFDASETCGFHLDNQYNLLKQIEKIFSEIPIVYLFNKMDLVEDSEYLSQYIDDEKNSIFISAIEGQGIDEINKKIDRIKKIERDFDEDDDYY